MIRCNLFLSIGFFLVTQCLLFAQSDLAKWNKVENYLLNNKVCNNSHFNNVDNKEIDNKNSISKFLVKVYKTTFSDFDGENCSFSPSCSEFFVESSKLTNFFAATLMFFDRLTRDSNLFSKGGYKIVNNKFYDPPSDYIFIHTKSIN